MSAGWKNSKTGLGMIFRPKFKVFSICYILDDLDEEEAFPEIFLKTAVMVLFLFIVVTQMTFSAGP